LIIYFDDVLNNLEKVEFIEKDMVVETKTSTNMD
jgi:hypothetical protein